MFVWDSVYIMAYYIDNAQSNSFHMWR